jgi:hypothetical protein
MDCRSRKVLLVLTFCAALIPTAVLGEDNDKGHEREGFDTEHIFAFMIGADTGTLGEREFESATTGRFGKTSGRYRAIGQEGALEFVPAPNFRMEVGGSFAAHDIAGVPNFEDRRQFAFQGLSLDLRYRLLDRRSTPVGLTFAVETHGDRIDEVSGARVRSYGHAFTLAVEREVVPNLAIAALNLTYQPEWTHFTGTGENEQEATVGASFGSMVRVGRDLLLGGEVRYLRSYQGSGLADLAGQALFAGPTAYFQLSERARLTANWSVQAWGRSAATGGALDLATFERHQARLVFGVNF